MRQQKPKKRKKFRLLLDAAFAKPSRLAHLSKKANVKHPVFDFGLSSNVDDEDIYALALKENRFVVTINYKDFRRLTGNQNPGVIAIPSNLSNEKIDTLLTQFVSENDPEELWGRAIKLPTI